jgi:uncharacterized protein (TIGR03085 family)
VGVLDKHPPLRGTTSPPYGEIVRSANQIGVPYASLVTSTADAERAALCELLAQVGPDAPTLCAGWTTRDLATHLMVRDRDPKVWAGVTVPRLAGLADRAMAARADTPYGEIVAAVRAGAPRWSPLGLPKVGDALNLVEYVVHHEDVRRAQPGWGPRAVPAALADGVWAALRVTARGQLRKAPDGVTLRRAGTGAEIHAKKAPLVVTVVGDPVELVLFVTGRRTAARVELSGDDAAVARLRATAFRM